MLRDGRPEYDATVGATARFQREFDGKQPGNPAKAAAAILYLVGLDEPPFRLILGRAAYEAVVKNDRLRLEADVKWRDVSVSVDF